MNPEDQHRSCPGFLDEYGVWNNGFECPIISGQIRVCCGTDFRRYCCSLENSFNNSEKSFLSTNKSIFSFIDQLNLTFLTVPILLTCILIIILLLLFILLSLSIYYHYRKRKKIKQDERSSTKQTIQVDHFPFSPPHHKVFFNENNAQTTSTSSLSVHLPSDMYSNDWRELFTTIEQSMNIYPTSRDNDHLYIHSNYLSYSKHPQDDIIV